MRMRVTRVRVRVMSHTCEHSTTAKSPLNPMRPRSVRACVVPVMHYRHTPHIKSYRHNASSHTLAVHRASPLSCVPTLHPLPPSSIPPPPPLSSLFCPTPARHMSKEDVSGEEEEVPGLGESLTAMDWLPRLTVGKKFVIVIAVRL